jgi:hypothetical protein
MTTNTLTRAEGYKKAKGKEELSNAVFMDWANNYNLTVDKVNGYENNRLYGDFIINKTFIECKSQPIGNYNQNFIELGEVTNKDYHADGWLKLLTTMKEYGVNVCDHSVAYSHFNFALTPPSNGAMMFYINTKTELIYVYSSKLFMKLVAEGISKKGMQRGLGNSNQDSVSCFIPNSQATFQKINGVWEYTGTVDFNIVMDTIKGNI